MKTSNDGSHHKDSTEFNDNVKEGRLKTKKKGRPLSATSTKSKERERAQLESMSRLSAGGTSVEKGNLHYQKGKTLKIRKKDGTRIRSNPSSPIKTSILSTKVSDSQIHHYQSKMLKSPGEGDSRSFKLPSSRSMMSSPSRYTEEHSNFYPYTYQAHYHGDQLQQPPWHPPGYQTPLTPPTTSHSSNGRLLKEQRSKKLYEGIDYYDNDHVVPFSSFQNG